jgi:hypothetical protein
MGSVTASLAAAEFRLAVAPAAARIVVADLAGPIAGLVDAGFAAECHARTESMPAPRMLKMNKGMNAARRKE